MKKRYLTVILLIAQLSTHIRHVPSFFGAKSARTVHGLKLYDESSVKQFIYLPS